MTTNDLFKSAVVAQGRRQNDRAMDARDGRFRKLRGMISKTSHAENPVPALIKRRDVQHAQLSLPIGRRTSLTADVQMTSSGLLAIGGFVSMIVPSTAVIVRAARRKPWLAQAPAGAKLDYGR
jgi:hypothetical protein